MRRLYSSICLFLLYPVLWCLLHSSWPIIKACDVYIHIFIFIVIEKCNFLGFLSTSYIRQSRLTFFMYSIKFRVMNFNGRTGWLYGFQNRHSLVNRKIWGEILSASLESVEVLILHAPTAGQVNLKPYILFPLQNIVDWIINVTKIILFHL